MTSPTRRQSIVQGSAGVAIFVAFWCLLTYGGFVKPLFLPTPTGIVEGLADYNAKGWLLTALYKSFLRVSVSVLLVSAVGIPIGLLMGTIPVIDRMLLPLVNGAKSVPPTGVIALVVLWFSIEERAKIVFLFLGSIFYMILLVRESVVTIPEPFLRVAQDIGATRLQVLTKVVLPAALPGILTAVAVANGIAWTYIVIAEFINSSEAQIGLGYLLSVGSRTQDSGKVFGILILIALLSSLTDWVLRTVKAKWVDW